MLLCGFVFICPCHCLPLPSVPAGMKQAEQQRVVQRFCDDPSVGVLLMDVVGAVGLDLSFVSHVFLLEPLADKSMEEQVWRRWAGRKCGGSVGEV